MQLSTVAQGGQEALKSANWQQWAVDGSKTGFQIVTQFIRIIQIWD